MEEKVEIKIPWKTRIRLTSQACRYIKEYVKEERDTIWLGFWHSVFWYDFGDMGSV